MENHSSMILPLLSINYRSCQIPFLKTTPLPGVSECACRYPVAERGLAEQAPAHFYAKGGDSIQKQRGNFVTKSQSGKNHKQVDSRRWWKKKEIVRRAKSSFIL